jgi:hypothetical protein
LRESDKNLERSVEKEKKGQINVVLTNYHANIILKYNASDQLKKKSTTLKMKKKSAAVQPCTAT